jgi:hypothetical protein
MSFLDKLKSVASQAKHATNSLASNSVGALWANHRDKVGEAVVSYVSQAANKGSAFIADDNKYKANVVDPAWETLPMPVRMLGRERLKWDDIFTTARAKVFVVDGENVSVHPEAKQRIIQLFAGMFPTDQLQKIETEATVDDANQVPPGA